MMSRLFRALRRSPVLIVCSTSLLLLTACVTPPEPEAPRASVSAPEPVRPLWQAAHQLADKLLDEAQVHRLAATSALSVPGPQALQVLEVDDRVTSSASPTRSQLTAALSAHVAATQVRRYVLVAPAASGAAGVAPWQLRTRLRAAPQPQLSAAPVAASGAASTPAARPQAFELLMEVLDPQQGRVLASATQRLEDAALQAEWQAQRDLERERERQTAAAAAAAAAARPASPAGPSERVQALNAEYVSLVRQGRDAEAQKVFGRIVADGLAHRNLTMRLLFAPGSTAFWPDPVLRRRYAGWLGELSRQMVASSVCLRIVGHASRHASAKANEALALRRAQTVRAALLKQESSLSARLSAQGQGAARSRPPPVGVLEDAADRRVEFVVVDCPLG